MWLLSFLLKMISESEQLVQLPPFVTYGLQMMRFGTVCRHAGPWEYGPPPLCCDCVVRLAELPLLRRPRWVRASFLAWAHHRRKLASVLVAPMAGLYSRREKLLAGDYLQVAPRASRAALPVKVTIMESIMELWKEPLSIMDHH